MTETARRPSGGITAAILQVAVGLVLGLLCAAAGLVVVGMGHGWGLPLRLGFLSLLLYPLAVLRWRSLDAGTSLRFDIVFTGLFAVALVLAAGGLDALPPPPQSQAIEWLILLGVPLAYGLAAWWLKRWRLHVVSADAMLLVVAVLFDVAAWNAFNGDRDGAGSARMYPELVVPWLLTWLGWQAIAVLALIRHLRQRT